MTKKIINKKERSGVFVCVDTPMHTMYIDTLMYTL